jgi:hypothetical protein
MKDYEISTPEKLDVALSANSLRKHSQLWRVAKGGSFRWTEALGALLAFLLVAVGVVRLAEDTVSGLVFVVIGLAMMGFFAWSHIQRQLKALSEIVERLEQERS